MLGGRITNADEDEVEDELAALELEVNGPATAPLPNVPDTKLPESKAKEQQPGRKQEPEAERRAMLAS